MMVNRSRPRRRPRPREGSASGDQFDQQKGVRGE